MHGRIVERAARATSLFAAMLSLSAAVPVTGAEAATPALIWRDVSRIGVQCLGAPGTAPGIRALQSAVCDRVRQLAARGAPAPVSVIQLGDPAIIRSDTVALLVHLSIQPAGRQRLVAFNIRPFRATAEQTSVLFGAAPRAAPIAASGAISPALDAALAAALSETLPWQVRPQGPRPISGRN